jgi:lipoprotein NlpD
MLSRGLGLMVCLSAIALAGCGSAPFNHAPVEDRAASDGSSSAVVAKPPPGFENAGKPGYYTVKPADTLIRIGLENGQSHKDIARWNALENPNKIEVGQVLRVIPPTSGDSVVQAKPVTSGTVTTTPIAAASVPAKPASAPAPALAPLVPPVKAASAPASGGDDELGWIWPGKGAVIAEFDEVKNKGVDISGAAGDSVLAAADGKVVYAGAGLRGYGNLIILKHNNSYITAYAHNQTLLVKEDQAVRRGQKIAEMGNSDAERVQLHFEIRRKGKPVDPTRMLPGR